MYRTKTITLTKTKTKTKRVAVRLFAFVMVAVSVICTGCTGGYSFTGASIPPEAKTLSLKQFPNYAPMVNPQLSQTMYEQLQQMFTSQTPLTVTDEDGDLQITGEIIDYTTRASSLSSDDNVATNRLTITVKVKFVNRYDSKADFEQNFSRFRDYDASRDFSSVETQLTSEIVTELCEDIFNKSVVNW